jgi:putative oxidoreductase
MATGRLVLRAAVGGLMVGHGLQKLTGRFDGPGLEGTGRMMESIGMHPARQQAVAVALTETVGGGLTAAGFLSPLGPAMITGAMAVAIRKVHRQHGLWAQDGGFEYNAVLLVAAFALAAEGPGLLSLDGLLRRQRSGLRWAVVELALGLGAAAAVLALADNLAARHEAPDVGGGDTVAFDDNPVVLRQA